jgi:WD40 repeat protein
MIARKGELISAYKLCRSIDGTIRVWRLTQHHHQYQHVFILPHISCNQSPLVVLDVDCNQYAFIASLASDGIVRLWSPDGVLFSTIQYSSKILSVEWDSSGMYILAPYTLGLSIWDSQGILIRNLTNTLISNIQYATWRNSTEFTIQSTSGIWIWRQNEDPVNIFDENIKSVRWNPSKTYLAIIQETQIGIYQDEYDIWWLNPDTTAIQFASKEFLLISGNSYGEIFLWNLESRIIISRLQGNIGKICRIKMRKDDEFLVACSEDEVQVWYLETQTFVRKIKLQGNISDM